MAGMKDSRTAPQPPVPATDRELILETALTHLVHDAQTAQTMASSRTSACGTNRTSRWGGLNVRYDP